MQEYTLKIRNTASTVVAYGSYECKLLLWKDDFGYLSELSDSELAALLQEWTAKEKRQLLVKEGKS